MKNVRMILIGCFLMMAACVKAQNINGKLVDEHLFDNGQTLDMYWWMY